MAVRRARQAVRRARQRIVGVEEFDGDALESLHSSSPDERTMAFEDVADAAEALQGLKPQEVRALWLRIEGRSYKQIAKDLGGRTRIRGPGRPLKSFGRCGEPGRCESRPSAPRPPRIAIARRPERRRTRVNV